MRCACFHGSRSLLASFAILWGCASYCSVVESKVTKATAVLFKAVADESAEPLEVMGEVDFLRVNGGKVHITGALRGLQPAGLHGFHIHELGGYHNNCVAAGAHFNPRRQVHGAPSDAERHVGDLGNVQADADGNAAIDIIDSLVALDGPLSVVGRSVVVHEKTDDLGQGAGDSKNTGNAGKRLGCGIIGVESEVADDTNAASSLGAKTMCLLFLLSILGFMSMLI